MSAWSARLRMREIGEDMRAAFLVEGGKMEAHLQISGGCPPL